MSKYLKGLLQLKVSKNRNDFMKTSFHPKIPTKFVKGFLPLCLMWGHFIPVIGGFWFDSLTPNFRFDLFLEARTEILKKLSLIGRNDVIKSFRFLLTFRNWLFFLEIFLAFWLRNTAVLKLKEENLFYFWYI